LLPLKANRISWGRFYRPSEDGDGGECQEDCESEDRADGVVLRCVFDEGWQEHEGGEAGEELRCLFHAAPFGVWFVGWLLL
jgi:hypothetical protein